MLLVMSLGIKHSVTPLALHNLLPTANVGVIDEGLGVMGESCCVPVPLGVCISPHQEEVR